MPHDQPAASLIAEPVPFTQADRDMLSRLVIAVFGDERDAESGLVQEVRELRKTLGRLYGAVVAAALAFAVGSISVVVAIVAVA